MKITDGKPLSAGLNVSLMEPVAMARLGEKQSPARKRRKAIAPKLWLKPAPSVKIAPSGILRRYTGYLPTVSDNGPPTMGPKPRANTYIDKGRIACVVPTPNSCRS